MPDLNALLNADLTDVSTEYPVLPAGRYTVKIVKLEATKSRDGNTDLMEQVVALEEAAQDRDGKPIGVGHQVTDRFSLTPTEKYTTDKIHARLKGIMQAVQGKDAAGAFGNPADYIGQIVSVKLDVEVDKNGAYPDKNRIARFVPKD